VTALRKDERPSVLHQVRYLNLKENVRIRRAGFAYRQVFDKFLHRCGHAPAARWGSQATLP